VQRVSYEPFTPVATPSPGSFVPTNLPAQGAYALYDCSDVPSTSSLSLHVRGIGVKNSSAAVDYDSLPTQIEAVNSQSGKWQAIKGQTRLDPSPAGGWNFSARVPLELVSRPGNWMRVRVRLPDASTQVSSLSVGE